MSVALVSASSQYLSISSALVSAYPLTMCCWVKTADQTLQAFLTKCQGGSTNHFLDIQQVGTGAHAIQGRVLDSSFGSSTWGTSVLTVGTWTPIVCVWESATVRRIYVGTSATRVDDTSGTSVAWPTLQNTLYVGRYGNAAQFVNGSMAEVAIYNVAFSDADASAYCLGGGANTVEPAGLVNYWTLRSDVSEYNGGAALTNSGGTFNSGDHPTINNVLSTLTITAPVSGSVTVGTPTNITWTSSGSPSNNLTLALSLDGGSTFTNIATGLANSGTYAWTPTGLPSASCKIKITDATTPSITNTGGTFTIQQAAVSNLPAFVSAQITSDSSGGKLAITFDRNVNYYAGVATVHATALIGQSAKRSIVTDGTAPAGAGTTTLTFTLRRGKPVFTNESGITVDLPLGLVIDSASSTYVNSASSSNSTTNNSGRSYAPMARIISKPLDDFTGNYLVEVEGGGLFGLPSVTMSITDGTHTLGPVTVTRNATLANYVTCPIKVFTQTFNLASLNDGQCTVNISATCPVSGGTRTDSITIWNNSGGSLLTHTYYVSTAGNDSTGDGSAGNPYASIQKVILAARSNPATDRVQIILNANGNYDPNVNYAGFNLAAGRSLLVTAGNGVTATLVGDTAGMNFHCNIPVIARGLTLQLYKTSNNDDVTDATYIAMFDACTLFNKATLSAISGGYSWNSLSNPVLWYCTLGPINTGPFNVKLMRGCTINGTAGDGCTGIVGSVVDYLIQNRGQSRTSGTISCSVPGATIQFSGTTYTTIDTTNGTHTFDASTVNYNTVSLLFAGINALTGWTATVSGSDGSLNPSKAYGSQNPINANSPVSLQLGQYGPHSDSWQQYVNSSNVVYSGVKQVPFNDTQILGSTDDNQLFWFDHDPAFTYNGLLVMNVEFPQMRLNTVRSAINGCGNKITDFLMMYVTMPYGQLNFINAAGAGEPLIPDNIALMYSCFRDQAPEGFSVVGKVVNTDEFWIVGCNWNDQAGTDVNGGGAQILAANYTNVSVNASTSVFNSLNYASLDLTPKGALLNRVPKATGYSDINGNVRGANSSIGAVLVGITPSPAIEPVGSNPVTMTLAGAGTNWTAGTPGSPTFSISKSPANDASIVSQTVSGSGAATLSLIPGPTLGTITITDPSSGATALAAAGGGGDAPGTHNYGPTQYQFINGNPEPGTSTASYGPTMYNYIHGTFTTQAFPSNPAWGPTMDAYISGARS